ncbi:MAG: PqqD family protein [Paracoccaceae bacterium]
MAEVWKSGEQFELTQIDDGFIIYDATRDRVHHLNPTAALVFALADGESTTERISELVQAQFGLDAAPTAEVAEILARFSEERLVEAVKPIAESSDS